MIFFNDPNELMSDIVPLNDEPEAEAWRQVHAALNASQEPQPQQEPTNVDS